MSEKRGSRPVDRAAGREPRGFESCAAAAWHRKRRDRRLRPSWEPGRTSCRPCPWPFRNSCGLCPSRRRGRTARRSRPCPCRCFRPAFRRSRPGRRSRSARRRCGPWPRRSSSGRHRSCFLPLTSPLQFGFRPRQTCGSCSNSGLVVSFLSAASATLCAGHQTAQCRDGQLVEIPATNGRLHGFHSPRTMLEHFRAKGHAPSSRVESPRNRAPLPMRRCGRQTRPSRSRCAWSAD